MQQKKKMSGMAKGKRMRCLFEDNKRLARGVEMWKCKTRRRGYAHLDTWKSTLTGEHDDEQNSESIKTAMSNATNTRRGDERLCRLRRRSGL